MNIRALTHERNLMVNSKSGEETWWSRRGKEREVSGK
jgi:hypothetical protein